MWTKPHLKVNMFLQRDMTMTKTQAVETWHCKIRVMVVVQDNMAQDMLLTLREHFWRSIKGLRNFFKQTCSNSLVPVWKPYVCYLWVWDWINNFGPWENVINVFHYFLTFCSPNNESISRKIFNRSINTQSNLLTTTTADLRLASSQGLLQEFRFVLYTLRSYGTGTDKHCVRQVKLTH